MYLRSEISRLIGPAEIGASISRGAVVGGFRKGVRTLELDAVAHPLGYSHAQSVIEGCSVHQAPPHPRPSRIQDGLGQQDKRAAVDRSCRLRVQIQVASNQMDTARTRIAELQCRVG